MTNQPDSAPKVCPRCGGGALAFDGIVFFEEGGYANGRYESEGEVETWRCEAAGCGKRFAEIPPMPGPPCANAACGHIEDVHTNVCLVDGCECEEFVSEGEAEEAAVA
jgi:hypothetical protein